MATTMMKVARFILTAGALMLAWQEVNADNLRHGGLQEKQNGDYVATIKQEEDKFWSRLLEGELTSMATSKPTPPTPAPIDLPTPVPPTAAAPVIAPTPAPVDVPTPNLPTTAAPVIAPTPPPVDVPTPRPPTTAAPVDVSTPAPTAVPSQAPSTSLQPTDLPILLYQNDFESPKRPVRRTCRPNLDIGRQKINSLYGTDENPFVERFTVEAVLINSVWSTDPEVLYTDPEGKGGNFSIGMLSGLVTTNDDKLGLFFDTQGKNFVNVCMDVSSIDGGFGCGGPFGIGNTTFLVSLVDSPSGGVDFSGEVLDSAEMSSPAAPNQWTFSWTYNTISLDASQSQNGMISVVWDLLRTTGYGTFDNLVIVASNTPGECSF